MKEVLIIIAGWIVARIHNIILPSQNTLNCGHAEHPYCDLNQSAHPPSHPLCEHIEWPRDDDESLILTRDLIV